MAGFLDKESRIVDMVLTNVGRELLSRDELEFALWAPFDDEFDYSPVIASTGSLSSDQLVELRRTQMEEALVREATSGYRVSDTSGSDTTNLNRPLFTRPQGKDTLPRMVLEGDLTGTLVVRVRQQKVVDVPIGWPDDGSTRQERGYRRFDASTVSIVPGYTKDSWPDDHRPLGFSVRVLVSGAEGLVPAGPYLGSDLEVKVVGD